MKNKNKIINELYEKSPDVRERIRKDVDFSQFEKKNAPAAKSSNGFKWATAVLSVALIAMIAVLAPIIAKTSKPGKSGKTPGVSYASDYVVFIDVNPSVRLDVSGGDVVTAQKGMNKDGVVLLYQENLVGKNIDEAATYLIEKMDEAGLVKDKGKVRISVADKKTGKRIDEKQRHALEVVNNLFKNKNKDVSAMILSDKEIDAIEDYYDNNNVGEYEMQMIEEFKAKLLLAIDKKIGRIDELLNILKPWEKDERKVKKLDQNDAETTRPGVITDADVSGIKDCLNMFDDILAGGGISQNVAENTDKDGEFKDYPFVMTVTVGNTGITAKMYYKEVNTVTETEIDDGEEETEVSTTLSGVMVFGDQKFDVTGKKEIETEGNEKETSIEFTTKSQTNPDNYVKIKQSVEVENGAQEVEYEYEIYENGEKAREFKLEVEDENGKTEVSFKMEIENVPEETEYKIIKGDVDGKFKIKYEKGKEKGFITVEAVEGGYKLTYNNGYSEVI